MAPIPSQAFGFSEYGIEMMIYVDNDGRFTLLTNSGLESASRNLWTRQAIILIDANDKNPAVAINNQFALVAFHRTEKVVSTGGAGGAPTPAAASQSDATQRIVHLRLYYIDKVSSKVRELAAVVPPAQIGKFPLIWSLNDPGTSKLSAFNQKDYTATRNSLLTALYTTATGIYSTKVFFNKSGTAADVLTCAYVDDTNKLPSANIWNDRVVFQGSNAY